MSEALAEEVTGFHVHRGALASLERRPLPAVDEVLDGARSVLVLEEIVDHTNVGAIFRSGAALGFDAVLLAPRCADPLYRRSVKVAMGAVFALPWTRLPDWYDALPTLSGRGFTTVALTLADDAVPVEEAVAGVDRLALVLGSEGHGLSPRWEQSADRRAVIPMAGRHRLAQRRGRHRGRLLRGRPPLTGRRGQHLAWRAWAKSRRSTAPARRTRRTTARCRSGRSCPASHWWTTGCRASTR